MAEALNKIFAQVAEFNQTMASLHNDFLTLVQRDIDRFLEKTKDLCNQMYWHGWTIVGLSLSGATLGIVGEIIPKSGPASTADSRLGANAGVADAITKKLSDNDFLKTTCKAASTVVGDAGVRAASSWYGGIQSKLESQRTLLKDVNVQNGQTGKSTFEQQIQLTQQAVSRLLDSKSKGG